MTIYQLWVYRSLVYVAGSDTSFTMERVRIRANAYAYAQSGGPAPGPGLNAAVLIHGTSSRWVPELCHVPLLSTLSEQSDCAGRQQLSADRQRHPSNVGRAGDGLARRPQQRPGPRTLWRTTTVDPFSIYSCPVLLTARVSLQLKFNGSSPAFGTANETPQIAKTRTL